MSLAFAMYPSTIPGWDGFLAHTTSRKKASNPRGAHFTASSASTSCPPAPSRATSRSNCSALGEQRRALNTQEAEFAAEMRRCQEQREAKAAALAQLEKYEGELRKAA